ncbi:MAG TPA: MFS transporter [Patescibacteria group bacterium]|nr:MFS transporter [Patescibacteria group bacterium]
MLRKAETAVIGDPVWRRIITLSLILFFLLLSDAILSTWVPQLIESTFESSIVMGFVMSFSSVVGFGADLIFPQLFKGINFKKLLFMAIIASIAFSLTLISATMIPFVLIFLISMAIWGIYYEIVGFANHQFVADSVPVRMHASTWAFMGVFKNLAYFLGPLLAGLLVMTNAQSPAYVAIVFTIIALIILLLSKKHHERPVSIEIDKISLRCEMEHWVVLFRKVWPVLVVGIIMGIVDAFFWTAGAVYTEDLAKISIWGKWFLPMYTLPALFIGFVVAKKGIINGKKKTALKFFLLSGIFLAMMNVFENVEWQLLVVFCSSFALSISYPLIEGVYSDIVLRMGRQRKHMIGLCSSTTSISYIVGPIIAGITASVLGNVLTFVYLGYFVAAVALILFALTPKKLKLPQVEIKKWKD